MTTDLRTSLLFALAALAAASCTPRETLWDKPYSVTGPVAAGDRLVWLNRSIGMVIALDPTGQASPLVVPVGARARTLAVAGSTVLVVGGRGDDPAVKLVSLPSGDLRTISIAGAYDRAEVSGDGKHAVFFYDPTAAVRAPGGPAAHNNDEIAILSIADAKVTTVALRTEALAPDGVVFDANGEFAAVVLDSAIAIVPLAKPEEHVVVPLKLPGGRTLHPSEAIFSPDGAFLYARAQGSDDVLAIAIDRSGATISASVNFLFYPGATGLVDLVVPAGAEFTHSVAALFRGTSRSIVALLDATGDTSRSRSAVFTHPLSELADLGDGRLFAYTKVADGTGWVAGWLPLEDRSDEDELSSALALPAQIAGGTAWFAHRSVTTGRGTGAALTRAVLEDDGLRLRVRLSPVVLEGTATALTIDRSTGALLAAVQVPREDSGAAPNLEDSRNFSGSIGSLVVVQPGSLELSGLPLDEDVSALGVVGGHVYAEHPSTLGDVTFVPTTQLARDSAHRILGFLAAGLLDREAEVTP